MVRLFSLGENPEERIAVIYALLRKRFAENGAIYALLGQLLGYSESLRASGSGLLQCLGFICRKALNKTQAGRN